MSKAFVAMSGGVDSSVTALLLKDRGYDVVGIFMRCWSGIAHPSTSLRASCAWERDAEDARRVATHLKIPFYVWDFEQEYKERVVNYMVEGYRQGITPNPDVMCNKEIKFGLFFKRALAMGADYIATGHYVSLGSFSETGVETAPAAVSRLHLGTATSARTEDQARHASDSSSKENLAQFRLGLYEAKDKNKDQSYFLWTLTQNQLKHCLFPIGDYLKSEVREIARRAGLPTAEKKDSQGICFLGKVTLGEFLKTYISPKKGPVFLVQAGAEGTTFKKIGTHDGAYFYTIGQRHGLNLSDKRLASGAKSFTKPHYVAEKNVAENSVVVAEGSDNDALHKKEIELTNVNFINPHHYSLIRTNKRIVNKLGVMARVRYRQPLARAHISYQEPHIKLEFEKHQKFVAPGQSAVFYSNNKEMLGGGIIL